MRNICSLKIITLIAFLLVSCQFFASFSAYGEGKLGYKPPMDDIYLDPENVGGPDDNLLYKEWCKNTFDNGEYIYEGYKDIAFNIKYTSEQAEADFWQTPFETKRSKEGDCEDAVFLFFSHLLPKTKNAEIVWGWVKNKRTGIAKAHAWYQLIDKEGNIYVMEGFSNDWNGIIPMEIVNQIESRKPILTIAHSGIDTLVCLALSPGSLEIYMRLANLHVSGDFIWETLDDKDVLLYAYSPNDSGDKFYQRRYLASSAYKEVISVFKRLHTVLYRYATQLEDERK